ncbi:hypothetical protein JW921_00660 [Candidatus Fermentibacterales bacterium]|nr:hypothetical protein [Candidatus Fermentibacterales bacterium]
MASRCILLCATAIGLLLMPGCAFIFETPGKVEQIEQRQLDMIVRVDSIMTRLESNEELLRQLRAHSGSSTAELLENLSALATELELALEDIRGEVPASLVVQDTVSAQEVSVLYEEAYGQYQRRDYVASAAGFREILDLYPSSPLADDALYYLAMGHESEGSPHLAIEEYLGLYYRYPDSGRAPAALYRSAMIYGYHNANSDRDRLLGLIIDTYPDSEEADLARGRLE